MKLQKIKLETRTGKAIRVAALAATLLGFGNAAQAAPETCASFVTPTAKVEDVTGTMAAVSACQYLLPTAQPNYVASIENINESAFFGFDDWTLNGDNGQLPNGGLTGTWSIDNVDFVAYDYIIVFKDGKNTNLVAFLFNEAYMNGVWSTPFMAPAFNVKEPKEVSHFTIAQRENAVVCDPADPFCNPAEIPEPSGIALMALGMIGAGLVLRRRRTQRA